MTTYNPNGNNWVSSNSMGKRLLIKAGWSNGEGLGKYKQGSNVHIKVSLKNEKDGIGLKSEKRQNDLSLMQCFAFDNILKTIYGKSDENNDEIDKQMERGLSRARFGRAVPKEFFDPIESDDLNRILCKSNMEKNENNSVSDTKTSINEGNANFVSPYTVFEYFSMKIKTSNINFNNNLGYICNKLNTVQNFKEVEKDVENKKRKLENDTCFELEIKKTKSCGIGNSLFDEKHSKKICENIKENTTKKISKTKRKSVIISNAFEKAITSCDSEHLNQTTPSENFPTIKSKKKTKSKNLHLEFKIPKDNEKNSDGEKIDLIFEITEQTISEIGENNLKVEKKRSKKQKQSESEKTDVKNMNTNKKTESQICSSEIISSEIICPWSTSNISSIEGYKYY